MFAARIDRWGRIETNPGEVPWPRSTACRAPRTGSSTGPSPSTPNCGKSCANWPSTEVLSQGLETPPPAAAAALGLEPNDPAYRLFRLRRADDTPLAVERGWYSPRRLPGLLDLDLTRSLYTLMAEHFGVQLSHGR